MYIEANAPSRPVGISDGTRQEQLTVPLQRHYAARMTWQPTIEPAGLGIRSCSC